MLFFNNSMSRILGYSAEEIKGMNNRTFMSAKTAREVYDTFNEVYRKGNPQKAFGWELIRKNGERRHVERLRDLQYKITDILGRKQVGNENRAILDLIGTALSLIEETEDTFSQMGREALLRGVRTTLESFCRIEDLCWESVHLDAFLEDIRRQAELKSRGRQVQIVREFERGMSVRMDRKVLQKVCKGLLKNAIESTPDEGRVEVKSELENGLLSLHFRDSGIGITPENQEMIFRGFFHTQDSEHYASKHPYFFNAGGTGLDLLWASVFAERLGFKIDFSSARCRSLPSDKEECPGRISSCPFIKSQEDCFISGGSLFSVFFPLELFMIEKKTDGGQLCSE